MRFTVKTRSSIKRANDMIPRSKSCRKTLLCLAGLACLPAGGGGFPSNPKSSICSPSSTCGQFGAKFSNLHSCQCLGQLGQRLDGMKRGLRRRRRAATMSEDSFASVARTPMPPGYEGEKKERGDSDEDLADFNRNVGKVIEALRTDYPRMFFDALNFEIYTDDLELIDPSGVVLSGVRPYQRLFATLRFFRQVLLDEVSTSFRLSYDASRQQVRVCWHFLLHARATVRPFHVDGVSVYSLNHRGIVRKHVVETIIVNGTPVKLPFAQAWINLPSWLAEGLQGGVRAPGLTSSASVASASSRVPAAAIGRGSSSWYSGSEIVIHHNRAAGGGAAFAFPFAFHGDAGDSAAVECAALLQSVAVGEVGESDGAIRRAMAEESAEGGGDGAWREDDAGSDVASMDEKEPASQDGDNEKDATKTDKRKDKKKKKNCLWPIIDSPWSCETSWDCHGGTVCCDLILIKVCCSNGIMQPKPGDLIPVYIPIPGRGRTELDQIQPTSELGQ